MANPITRKVIVQNLRITLDQIVQKADRVIRENEEPEIINDQLRAIKKLALRTLTETTALFKNFSLQKKEKLLDALYDLGTRLKCNVGAVFYELGAELAYKRATLDLLLEIKLPSKKTKPKAKTRRRKK